MLIPETGRIMVLRTMENTIKRKFIEQYVESDEPEPDHTGDDQVYPPLKIEPEDLAPNPQDQIEPITYYPNLRRSARVAQEPDRYGKLMIAAHSCLLHDPRSYEEARDRRNHRKWREAMEDEIWTIQQKPVWTLTERPAGKKFIATRWVYQVKKKANGIIDSYKAMLVAKRFSQKPGTYLGEIYAPVMK